MEIDNGFKNDGTAMRRFYLNRIKDETGVSRTGRVLEGVLTQSGKVFVEWRPPHSTMGIYNNFEEFMLIHVDCHPSCNEVVWLDLEPFHCFACGAGGNDGYFCARCGSGRRDYIGRDSKHCRKCGNSELNETYDYCPQCGVRDPLSAAYAFAVQDAMAQKGLSDSEVVSLIDSKG